jgi:hypothetical protein
MLIPATYEMVAPVALAVTVRPPKVGIPPENTEPATVRFPPIEASLLYVEFVVIAPVVALVVISSKPFCERTGPLKVELPIRISCLGLSQPHHATVRDMRIIHEIKKKERGQLNRPLSNKNICSCYAPGEPNTARGSLKPKL